MLLDNGWERFVKWLCLTTSDLIFFSASHCKSSGRGCVLCTEHAMARQRLARMTHNCCLSCSRWSRFCPSGSREQEGIWILFHSALRSKSSQSYQVEGHSRRCQRLSPPAVWGHLHSAMSLVGTRARIISFSIISSNKTWYCSTVRCRGFQLALHESATGLVCIIICYCSRADRPRVQLTSQSAHILEQHQYEYI